MGVFDFLPGLSGGDGADGVKQSGDSTDADSSPENVNRPADPTPADFRERAESLARRSDAPTLDFTVESLRRLDELVAGPQSAVDDEFAYGSYLGETVVRRFGGEWYAEDDWQVAVDLPEDQTTIAVFDAAKMSIAREPVFAEVVAHLEAQGAEHEPVSADAGEAGATEDEKPTEDSDGVPSAEDAVVDEVAPVEDAVPEEAVAADSDESTDDGTEATDEATETETVIVEGPDDGRARGTDAPDEARDTDTTGELPADIHEDAAVSDERDDDHGPKTDITKSDDRDESEVSSDWDQSTAAESGDEGTTAADDDSIDAGDDAAEGRWESQTGIGPADDAPDTDTDTPSDRCVLRTAVETLADDWPERNLDVAPDSLPRLDVFVDDQWDGRFRASSLAERTVDYEDRDDPLTQLGAYYGEVLVRHLDGEWVDTEDGEGAMAVPDADGWTERVRVFDVARACLTEPSAFAYWYDSLLNQLALDEPAVSDGRCEVYDGDSDVASLTSGDVITQFATAADEFVRKWPDYPFDYSPRSLRHLDELATNVYANRDFSGVPLADGTDPDSLQLTAAATEIGAYFAAVLLRHRDAQVRMSDAAELVIDTAGEETTVDPVATAGACLRGEDSFTEAYARHRD